MNQELSNFAARLRELIADRQSAIGTQQFSDLALELFALQFQHNSAYQTICRARGVMPEVVEQWTQIPAVPTGAFKELELSCVPLKESTVVFHSSGTTERKPSSHFHCAESLAVYEASLWPGFEQNVLRSADGSSANSHETRGRAVRVPIILTPPPEEAPHSSLVHMFEIVRRKLGAPDSAFIGRVDADGAWTLDFDAVLAAIQRGGDSLERRDFPDARGAALCRDAATPQVLLGTAFSFVHLLDYLVERDLRVELPAGSRVMETGGYKNRSRSMPKVELHALITHRLGVPADNILCEYGMSELSSQAYDLERRSPTQRVPDDHLRAGSETGAPSRIFNFPPWARAQIISPETGREVADGETGLIRIFDLANVFSVAAVQTEDLGVRRGDGFELIGRAQLAEPRGCSLMTA